MTQVELAEIEITDSDLNAMTRIWTLLFCPSAGGTCVVE
jgi:hypothetical protein